MKTPETKKKWLAQRLLPHVVKWRFFLISSLHCGVLVPFFFSSSNAKREMLDLFFFFLPHFVLVSIGLPASLSFSSFFSPLLSGKATLLHAALFSTLNSVLLFFFFW